MSVYKIGLDTCKRSLKDYNPMTYVMWIKFYYMFYWKFIKDKK